MKPSQLIKFRRDRGLNQTKMALRLGIGRDTLRRYEMLPETKSVPLVIALACGCISWGLPPFGDKGSEK